MTTMSFDKVVQEGTAWPTVHIFVPAVVAIYTQDIWKLLSIIYIFESFEFLVSQIPGMEYWAEISLADGLVSDIIMGLLGFAVIRFLKIRSPENPSKWAFLHFANVKGSWYETVMPCIHVLLVAGSGITFQFLPENSNWDFVVFGVWYSAVAFMFGLKKWALFSAFNIAVVAIIASFIGYTPLVSLAVVFLSMCGIHYYRQRPKRGYKSIDTQEVPTVRATPLTDGLPLSF